MAQSKYYPCFLPKGLRKTTKTIQEKSHISIRIVWYMATDRHLWQCSGWVTKTRLLCRYVSVAWIEFHIVVESRRAITQAVRRWHLTTNAEARVSGSVAGFSILICIHHCSISIYLRHWICTATQTRQHIIISVVFSFDVGGGEVSSLTLQLTRYRVSFNSCRVHIRFSFLICF
jgi:hypothetical protein